jgi:type II secretory pathway pseudopilin PulG
LKRKGFTLIVVLAMMSILTAVALMLWSSTNLSVMIAGNQRRHTQANILADSGIQHFRSLNLSSREITRMAGDGEFVMILDQTLGDGRYYVFARPLDNDRFEVVSTGEKAGAVSTKTATFETIYEE